jgi:predicted aspartyl protease
MQTERLTFTFQYGGITSQIDTEVELFSAFGDPCRGITANAVWDTGATISVITPTVAQKLGVLPIDRMEITGVNNISEVDVVDVSVLLPGNILIQNLRVPVCTIDEHTDILIGMDIITRGDFAMCNAANQTQFSFAVPPFPEKIDFMVKRANTSHKGKEKK